MNTAYSDQNQPNLLARWRPHLTFRTRLTLTFTALVAIAGALTVIIVTVFMRTVPNYSVPVMIADQSTDATVPGVSEAGGGADEMAQATAIMLRTPADILNTTLIISLLALAIVVVGGALIAWIIAGRMLRPLKAVNTAAQLAGAGSLDHRIGLDGPRDEVRDLADTFDLMLERLDLSFTTTQRFAANASHELRTPLTTTQTMLEVALADPDIDAAELRAVAERVLEANQREIETVEALLNLAELNGHNIGSDDIDLVSLVQVAVCDEGMAIDAVPLTITIDSPISASVQGDAVLLRQAILNLIRNAIRHNVQEGTIHLTIHQNEDMVVLSLENTGEQLSETLVANLKEPFFRSRGRVTGNAPHGHGLGLAIVESVVRVHRGALRLQPRTGGGLIVEIEIPKAAENR